MNPVVQVRVPEQVVAGGVDACAAAAGLDGEVVQVGVVGDQDRGDRLGAGPAGFGVGGEDLVAGFEVGDWDGLAVGEQHRGACGEGLAAARRGQVREIRRVPVVGAGDQRQACLGGDAGG